MWLLETRFLAKSEAFSDWWDSENDCLHCANHDKVTTKVKEEVVNLLFSMVVTVETAWDLIYWPSRGPSLIGSSINIFIICHWIMTFLATLVASFHFLTRRMRTDPISKAPFGGTTARPLFMEENASGDGRRRKEAKCGAGQSCKMSNDKLGIFLGEHTVCHLRQFLEDMHNEI